MNANVNQANNQPAQQIGWSLARNGPLGNWLPPLLPPQQFPTQRDRLMAIPQWVAYEVTKVLRKDPHYENSMYGPFDSYLNAIFPLDRQYSIIPQARLRRHKPNARQRSFSVSSSGGEHPSREIPGREVTDLPDFLVVKAIPTGENQERKHYVLAVVELKLAIPETYNADIMDAMGQMYRYLERLAHHPFRVPALRGFLIVGNRLLLLQLAPPNGDNPVRVDILNNGYWHYISDQEPQLPTDRLTHELTSIAITHWNRQTEN